MSFILASCIVLIHTHVARTYPHLPYFGSRDEGQVDLYTVLHTYSQFDAEVGYCSGMSHVAGLFILHVSPMHQNVLD